MERVNVTKTFLPPLEEYNQYLQQIWNSGQLTNQGPLLKQFETKAADHLGVSNVQFVANGTVALQLALRALDITEGEIITTPFSYVATASSILWEHCDPIFVDIRPDTFCIDATKIEAAITDKTKAIMAVHVFGLPCDVEAIEAIATKHDIKVIYDGAHAFGVTYKGKSLLDYGDVSTCSFHATKLFHTIEGGCVISKDKTVQDAVELIKHFGHVGDTHYRLGINAKSTEFQAAMGLCNLNYVTENIAKRKTLAAKYDQLLDDAVQRPAPSKDTEHNFGYYPVVFASEAELTKAFEKLNAKDIYPRRYFYPSLNKLPYLETTADCPVSEDIALKIACLPLYVGLAIETIELIAKTINED